MRSTLHRRCSSDKGVTLVEAVVALFIAAGVFTALAAATVTSLRSTLVSRQNQQASDIATQGIEKARAMTYGAMTMVTADVPGTDAANLTGNSTNGYLASYAGAGSGECAVVTAGGALTQHVLSVNRNIRTFSSKTYITYPGLATGCKTAYASVRRVTVVVTWVTNGVTHTRRLSTLVSDTVRGLPLPRFTLAASRTINTSASGPVALPIRLANQGARDSFEFTVAPTSPTYLFYLDDNRDGVHQSTELTPLGNSPSGKPYTGLLDPGQVFFAVAYRVAGPTEVSSSVTVTATSVAQPTLAGASHFVTDSIVIAGSPACSTACYARTASLHNSATAGGATATQEVMPANLNAPTFTGALPAYSGGTTPGRAVAVGRDAVGTNSLTDVADWRFQMPANSKFDGTVTVTLWASADSTAGSHTLSFALGTSTLNTSNNNFTSVVQAATPASMATSWAATPQQITVTLPVTNLTIASGQYLVLRVQVASSSSGPMHLQYDTTTYPAGMSLPVVYGLP